jgi:hypothetical protein
MLSVIWNWLKGLFAGKGYVQIGKGHQSLSGSTSGANSPVISAGRDLHLTLHGDAATPPRTEKDELVDWIRKNGFREPVSQILPQVIRLAQIIGNADVEHWARLELFGYNRDGGMREDEKVPEYRRIVGQHHDSFNRPLQVPAKLHFVNYYGLRYGAATLEEWSKKTEMQNIADPGTIELIRDNLGVIVSRFCFSPLALVEVVSAISQSYFGEIS